MMRVVLRGHEPRWVAPVAVLVAVLVTVALTAVPIRIAGANPPAAFERYLVQPLSSTQGVYEVLLSSTPLLFTGIAVAIAGALFPVGQLADISNSGTLFAFFMVSIAVMMLRVKEPNRRRPFRTPFVWIIAPLSAAGCAFLFWNLPHDAKMVLPIWGGIGLVIYLLYGIRKSNVARGIIEVPELDPDAPPGPVPPMPGAPSPTDRRED